MLLRWFYKTWKYFWLILVGMIVTLAVLLLVVWGLLQMKSVQDLVSSNIEKQFNRQYEGTLTIGSLRGKLPLHIQINELGLVLEQEEGLADTVASVREVTARIGFRDLLQGRFTIKSASLNYPAVHLIEDGEGTSNLRIALTKREVMDEPEPEGEVLADLPRIYLTSLEIEQGTFTYASKRPLNGLSLPDTLTVENINARTSFEINNDYLFLNLFEFYAQTPALKAASWSLTGQFYADERFLEFNTIKLDTPQNSLQFTLIFEEVDIKKPELEKQILDSEFRANIQAGKIALQEFSDILPALKPYHTELFAEVNLDGNFSEIHLNRLDLVMDQSRVLLYGKLDDVLDRDALTYDFAVDYIRVAQKELDAFKIFREKPQFTDWHKLGMSGKLNGSLSAVDAELTIRPPTGNIHLDTKLDFAAELKYDVKLEVERVRLRDFPSLKMPDDRINGSLVLKGSGTDPETAASDIVLKMHDTRLNGFFFEKAEAKVVFDDGFVEPSFGIYNKEGALEGTGWIDLLSDDLIVRFSGSGSNVNVPDFLATEDAIESDLNFRYEINSTGMEADKIYGSLFVELNPSVYNGSAVEHNRLIVRIDSPEKEVRTLEITGNMMEATVTGDIIPSRIIKSYHYWADGISAMIRERSVFTEFRADHVLTETMMRMDDIGLKLDINAKLDDLSILNSFMPDFPYIETLSNLHIGFESDAYGIKVNGKIATDFLEMDTIRADSLVVDFNFSLDNQKRTDFLISGLDIRFRELHVGDMNFENAEIYLDGYDEAFVLQKFRAIAGDDVEIGLMLSAVFSEYDVDIRIMEFYVGDEDYLWQNLSHTPIVIDRDGRVLVKMLEFGNQHERVVIDGIFSENPADNVAYMFNDFQLEKISDLLNLDFSFKGGLNGSFSTKTLRTFPEFTGRVAINNIEIDDRVIGDASLRSVYNREDDRFELDVRIDTDPDRYEEYLAMYDGVRQDIHITGHLLNPVGDHDPELPGLVLNVDFNELDLWVLPFIVEGIFDDIGGKATGNGSFELYADRFYYNGTFDLVDLRLKPVFLQSELVLNGKLTMNYDDGLRFHDVRVRDRAGGNGTIYGRIQLTDFKSVIPLNLTLVMNRLQFINNRYEEEVPFFGRIAGSGAVNMSGTTDQPFISTPEPIMVTQNSIINIPLESDAYFDERTRFIEFVDDFSVAFQPRPVIDRSVERDRSERTFLEQFQLDLQFVAEQEMNVRLIFDQITSEILTARGVGRMRLTLQDEVIQVFGRFDVSGGDYNFVGGDLFARRFTLRDGGTISWDGDPEVARLDVTAVYRARPNIAALRPDLSQDTPVRIPVDLVLHITGTLDNVENDFYFDIPSGVDASQTAAYLGMLNSEDQKLIQATSLLLTGNFIPMASDIRESDSILQGRAGQIGLGTLLSAQINNLLNSNLSNLDIDLNMSGFDQADLGVALRLFDDRLTLRREGVVTGPDANLGDFEVTYRINRYLSVEVFHRRDPLLPGIVSPGQNQFESVNGIGLEARIQFNTWSELSNRVLGSFRKMFSAKKEEEEADYVMIIIP